MATVKLKLVNGDRHEIEVTEGPAPEAQFSELLAGEGPLVAERGPYRWVQVKRTHVRFDAIATARLDQ